ncbi:MAG: AMP-binding protein [Micromonosporaceae bacterium]
MTTAGTCVTEHVLGLAPGRNGRPAVVDDASGAVITYSRLAVTVRAAAAGLARRGMRPGDVAGVYVASAPRFVLASLAIRAAGGVPSPVSPDACARTTEMLLGEFDARMLITDTCLEQAALEITERCRVRQVICFGDASETTRFDALLRAGMMRPLHRDGGDVALVAAMREREGEPELVRVTYRELAAQMRRLALQARLAAWDIIVTGPPYGDGRGYSALLDLALAAGATVVGAPTAGRSHLLSAARTHRGTIAFVPPGVELPGHGMRLITIS